MESVAEKLTWVVTCTSRDMLKSESRTGDHKAGTSPTMRIRVQMPLIKSQKSDMSRKVSCVASSYILLNLFL